MKATTAWTLVLTGWLAAACTSPLVRDGSEPTANPAPNPGGPSTGGATPPPFALPPPSMGGTPPGPAAVPCVNLQCQQTSCRFGNCMQPACPAGQRTTLRGKVFDPAGKVPLYNVLVYVRNAALDPIPTGPSCDRCDTPVSGRPITSALTDTKGEFLLDDVPVGTDIPLVIQVGKWRREITVPRTQACGETVLEDPQVMRLPRTRDEGNIPKIALTTGGADVIECLLRKMGIADSEFTPEAGPGRVNLFAGQPNQPALPAPIPIIFPGGATKAYAPTLNGGAAFTPARSFWDDPAAFDRYDMVILSCEGNSYPTSKSVAARAAVGTYADKGGRVFASHWHNFWLHSGPAPWPQVAMFTNLDPSNTVTLPDSYVGEVDTTFPKGNALADWLVNVGASATRGRLPIREGRVTVASVNPMYSTQWIRSAMGDPQPAVQYFTFNTPAGAPADKQCGRVVFTDIHVSAADSFGPPFPTGCTTTEMSPQEKALEFILFDLSSCVQPDDKPPIIR
jgi:hypothetical protein